MPIIEDSRVGDYLQKRLMARLVVRLQITKIILYIITDSIVRYWLVWLESVNGIEVVKILQKGSVVLVFGEERVLSS